MSPTFRPGEKLLASPLPYFFIQPRVNDIIICSDPRDGRILVKRIIKIDGKRFFVQGDHAIQSTDSRQFGMIERENIIGKVIYPV